jgi:hypothetical protein
VKHWHEVAPGILYLYAELPHLDFITELDFKDAERSLQGLLPCFAIVELHPDSSHCLAGLLERTTGSGPLTDPRWSKRSDAGLLYGPVRSAAWRAMEAKHWGLPKRRSIFVVLSGTIDPACIFEQTDHGATYVAH